MNKEIIGKYVAILGLLLFWAPLWGIVDSYFIMSSSFQEITLFGSKDSEIPRDEMSSASLSFAIGAILSLVSLTLMAFSVVGLNYRASWLFWALTIYSMLLLIIIPIGTVCGAVGLALLVFNRKKFGLENNAAK